MNTRRPSVFTSTQPQFYFVRHPSTYWHPALLINEAEDVASAIRRVVINPGDDRTVSYKLYDPKSRTAVAPASKVYTTLLSELGPRIPLINSLASPPDDLVQCDEINEPVILYSVVRRYDADKIYTSIGDILVAVNPFRVIPGLYSSDSMLRVIQSSTEGATAAAVSQPSSSSSDPAASSSSANPANVDSQIEASGPPPLPPHVYNIANAAREGLIRDGVSQSIVISGESGSGKCRASGREH